MKHSRAVVWTLTGLAFFVLPPVSPASDRQGEEPMQEKVALQDKKPGTSVSIPVYRPPLRGAPIGRVGGGTRGTGSDVPVLAAFVPDHIGLTTREQPSLFWFLSAPTDYVAEFTLIDDQSIQPLLEKRFDPPVQAGVHRIRIEDSVVRLSTNTRYRWFVALIVDPRHRSKDIIAGGSMEYIGLQEGLRARLAQAERSDVPNINAEAGIWYDALSSISDLIEKSPQDPLLQEKRASLLEQVGLSEVARDMMKSSGAGGG